MNPKKPLFRNPLTQAAYDKNGFVKISLLNQQQVDAVRILALLLTLAGANLSKYSMYSMAAFSVSTLLNFFEAFNILAVILPVPGLEVVVLAGLVYGRYF